MKILVTGAAGTVGSEIIKILSNIREITTLATDIKTFKNIRKLKKFQHKIKIFWGNICDKNFLEKITKDIDCTIHLAAVIPPLADKKTELADKVNVNGTKNLIECLEKNSPQSFFIYCSSIAVYGDRLNNPYIKASDEVNPSQGDYYAQTKIKAEEIVKNSKLDWTIFRLTAVFGFRNHKISNLMFHMPLKTPIEIITPEDAAEAFVKAIYHKDSLNKKIFNLAGGQQCRILYKDFLKRALELYGIRNFNFHQLAFAQKNFHCGYLEDSEILHKILNLKPRSIEQYFEALKLNIPVGYVIINLLFEPIIKKFLLQKSEPFKAIIKNNHDELKRFFGKQITFE